MVAAVGASLGSSAMTSQRASGVSGTRSLDAQQQETLRKLQARDKAVRAHEAAHLGAAGGLARGGASFTYEIGPDGRAYAVGGEVGIDTSAGNSPEDTIAKAERIRRAALAPADPSAQDIQVAAQAARMAAQARAEQASSAATDASSGNAPASAIGANRAYLAAQKAGAPLLGGNIAEYA